MSYHRTSMTPPVWTMKADAVLAQAAAVQNTWYTVLNTTPNVLLYYVGFSMTIAIETLELRITIDGNVFTGTQAAAVVGTVYHPSVVFYTTGTLQIDSWLANLTSPFLEGRSVKVEVRKTTAVGAGTLNGLVRYAQR